MPIGSCFVQVVYVSRATHALDYAPILLSRAEVAGGAQCFCGKVAVTSWCSVNGVRGALTLIARLTVMYRLRMHMFYEDGQAPLVRFWRTIAQGRRQHSSHGRRSSLCCRVLWTLFPRFGSRRSACRSGPTRVLINCSWPLRPLWSLALSLIRPRSVSGPSLYIVQCRGRDAQ